MYLAVRDAYPTKALAHTRVIALAGVDKNGIELWKESLGKQTLNEAPIDLYIMNDRIKGRLISTELGLLHLALVKYTYPRIIFISDGNLQREGFTEVLKYIYENRNKGWFKNLEEFYVIKNYIADYDEYQEYLNPDYANGLTEQVVFYLNKMCTNKDAFPHLRIMNFNMNGYNSQRDVHFQRELINVCSTSTGVSIFATDVLIRYPVICMDSKYISSSMKQTYYYNMEDKKDAAQCRYNWNWEVVGVFNNDITGPFPLPSTQHCSLYY